MRKPGGFRREDILADQEFRRLQLTLDMMNIRFGIGQVFTENIKGFDFSGGQIFHHRRHHHAGFIRKGFDVPGFGKLGPGVRIGHLLIAGENIGQRAHVAGALNVVLAALRIDAAAFNADVAQKHLEIGAGHDIVHAADVLGDAQRVHQHGRFDGRHFARQLANGVGGNAADFGGPLGRILHHFLFELFKSLRAGVHIFLVVQIFLNEHVHHAVDQGHIGADLQGHVHLGKIHHVRAPRIDHDQFGAGQHSVFDERRSDRMRFGNVGAHQNDHFCLRVIGERIGHRARTE